MWARGTAQTDDMTVDVADSGAWRVTCPPRQRARNAIHALAGMGAGVLLGVLSIGGILEGMAHPSWGARVFLFGWLGPLGLIAVLLLIRGALTLAKVWQTDVLESDGTDVLHRLVAPWGTKTVFQTPVDRLDPFDPPTAREVPELADEEARRAFRAPLILRYRPDEADASQSYGCMASTSYDEQHRLAATLNPLLTCRAEGGNQE